MNGKPIARNRGESARKESKCCFGGRAVTGRQILPPRPNQISADNWNEWNVGIQLVGEGEPQKLEKRKPEAERENGGGQKKSPPMSVCGLFFFFRQCDRFDGGHDFPWFAARQFHGMPLAGR